MVCVSVQLPTNKCFDTKYIIDEEDKAAIEELELRYSDKQVDNIKMSTSKRKRLPRRGGKGRRGSKGTANLNILQSNCDGYISKKESIENILKKKEIDVLLLNETALKGKRKVKIKDYFSFSKNREKVKGGVATVIANYLKPETVKVTEGKEGDEYIISRLDHVIPAINIVNIYGQQESRTSKDEITASWLRLQKDFWVTLTEPLGPTSGG